MSISGYSKISINCRVASKITKKLIMMLQQQRLHAQPPHATFVKADPHDGQKLVITTNKRPNWREDGDTSTIHTLGKKVHAPSEMVAWRQQWVPFVEFQHVGNCPWLRAATTAFSLLAAVGDCIILYYIILYYIILYYIILYYIILYYIILPVILYYIILYYIILYYIILYYIILYYIII